MNKLTTKINLLYFSTLMILIVTLVTAGQMMFVPFIKNSEQVKADLLLAPYASMFEHLLDEGKMNELDELISSMMLLENEDNNQPLLLFLKIDRAIGNPIIQVNEDRESIFSNKIGLFSPSTFEFLGSLEIKYNDYTYKQIVREFTLIVAESIVIFIILFIIGQRVLSYFVRPLSKLTEYLNDVDTLKAESLPQLESGVSSEVKSVWDATKVLLVRIGRREDELKAEHEIAKMALREKVSAEVANQSKSTFLANMSHEIRTPLTAIIGFADTLQNPSLTQRERVNSTNTIIRNGNHLLEIINDILDISKIESDKLEIENIEVSLLQIVKDIEMIFGPMVKEKGLDFIVDYKFPLPKSIHTDPTRLKQILFNLLGNAKKFTEIGLVKLSVCFNEENRKIQISVKDSGIGLTNKQIEQIFTPFSQADASTTRKYGGTGLGLTISRKLANMLGGDIHIESEIDIGSEFILIVEAGPVSEMYTDISEYSEVELVEVSQVVSTLAGKLLIAEDTKDIQDLLAYYLDQTSIDVIFANNGEEAYKLAMNDEFDLILMDMQMPVLDGLSATKKLRESGYKKPIVALTANAMKEDQNRYKISGLDGFIAKPIDKNEIYRAIAEFVPSLAGSDNGKLSQGLSVSKKAENEVAKTTKEEKRRQTKIRLTKRFKEHLPQWLDEISLAIQEKNQSELCHVSHVLKGLGGSFGYPEITDMSGQINEMAKIANYDAAASLYEELVLFCVTNCEYSSVSK